MPFVALIVGPYTLKGKTESILKIFHLKKSIPYNLGFKLVPTKKLRKKLLDDIKEIFSKYSNSQDRINLREKWSTVGSKEDKFMKCIE
jgi:hypothetical protein